MCQKIVLRVFKVDLSESSSESSGIHIFPEVSIHFTVSTSLHLRAKWFATGCEFTLSITETYNIVFRVFITFTV